MKKKTFDQQLLEELMRKDAFRIKALPLPPGDIVPVPFLMPVEETMSDKDEYEKKAREIVEAAEQVFKTDDQFFHLEHYRLALTGMIAQALKDARRPPRPTDEEIQEAARGIRNPWEEGAEGEPAAFEEGARWALDRVYGNL